MILHCPNRLLNMTNRKISDPIYQQHPSHDVFPITTRDTKTRESADKMWRSCVELVPLFKYYNQYYNQKTSVGSILCL